MKEKKMFFHFNQIMCFGITLIFLSLPASSLNPVACQFSDEDYFKDAIVDNGQCTTGIACGAATADGRPLLWKNRDVGTANQEFHYVDNGAIPFISVTYWGNVEEYYGGVNAVGFALENSDSHNLRFDNCSSNGWGFDADDGEIHMLALSTCTTVDDFQRLLDSTNTIGRTLNTNYGTIDAFGNAAIFECSGHRYTRFDAIDSPHGVIIRANYSLTGSDDIGVSEGTHRYARATDLCNRAAREQQLTAQYIYSNVVRDISMPGLDPYPLPFDGYYSAGYRWGFIPNGLAICRANTQSTVVVQGVREGERAENAIVWAMCGNPIGSVTTPLWVRAGSVPPEYDTDEQSTRINNRAREIYFWVKYHNIPQISLDTWRLTNSSGFGIWDYTIPLEDWVFRKTYDFLNSPEFTYDQLETFQNNIARQVADSLESWTPRCTNREEVHLEYWGEDGGIYISWDAENENLMSRDEPVAFAVYRSDQPFREGEVGDSLTCVTGRSYYFDENPPAKGAFYRIENQY